MSLLTLPVQARRSAVMCERCSARRTGRVFHLANV